MVTLPMVSSFFSTCGCFLQGGWSPSGDLPPLSLACGWPPGANGSPLANGGASRVLGLKILRVQGKGGWTDARTGLGRPAWADRPRLNSARFGHPFTPVGPQVIMHFPPPLAWFWRCHLRVQDGGSPRMKFGLLRFNPRGCSFVALRSLPPLEVIASSSWTWTRLRKCFFELVANPSFMSMFSYINTTLPNAYT
jgi:hypothetical protein